MPADTLRRRATPADLRRTDRLRLFAALTAGNLAALGSRIANRGSGASIRGQVMTRLAPGAFQLLLRAAGGDGVGDQRQDHHHPLPGRRRTDGLGAEAGRLVHNADGANLHHGIASALSERPDADVAILETDERVVADLIRPGKPEVLVLLNFSRDQLDRHHEIKGLGRSWRECADRAGRQSGPVVVANADDP